MKKIGVKSSASGVHSLDGFAAKLGTTKEIPTGCSLCGAVGHKASAHAGGKAVVDGDEDSGHGPAKDMDRATQDDFNKSRYNTGSPNYQPPGYEGGMS